MADLDQLRHPDNLARAWRWIRSNPEAAYKSYFRTLYQRFAVAEDALLYDLAGRLKRGVYEPEAACKLFHPKTDKENQLQVSSEGQTITWCRCFRAEQHGNCLNPGFLLYCVCRLKKSVQIGLKKVCKVQRLRHPQPALKQRLARPCVDILVPGYNGGVQ
jgi:hypothetical protein